MTYRPSIAERIAWTSGQLQAAEIKVLVALWSCGDYETGRNCKPYINTIVARSGLSRATVNRTLASLRNRDRPGGPWIIPTVQRHRHPTDYDIQIDRLATSPPKEQQMSISAVIEPPRSEAHNEPQRGSEAQNEPQRSGFEAQNEPPTSDPDLVPDVRTHTARAREDADQTEAQNEPQIPAPLIGRPSPPRCQHPHAHAWCEGRVHVPRLLHFEFLDRLGTEPGESPSEKVGRLIRFYATTMFHLSPYATIADPFAFWNAAFKAWVATTNERRHVHATTPAPYTCPHDPPCEQPNWRCRQRTALEAAKVHNQRRQGTDG